MRKKLLWITLSFFLYSASTFAQGDEVPQAVKETFTHQYPNAVNVNYQDNPFTVWVDFTVDGELMKASYTRKGVWKGSEKEWAYKKLPEAVKDGFKKSRYADREVEETKIVYRPGGIARYRLKAKKNDLQKKFLYFNEKGQLVDDSITL
jgi:hypothetical protein